MTETLQHVLVVLAAIVAAAWLVVTGIRRRRAKEKCDTCALAQTLKTPPR